jgi:hypothetical protein
MHTTIESPPEAHAGRPKWNSILKADDQSRMGKAMAPPGAQPNQRSRVSNLSLSGINLVERISPGNPNNLCLATGH